MVSGAFCASVDKPYRENVDMPRRDLERVPAVVQKSGVTAIEHDVVRRTGVPCLAGYRQGFPRGLLQGLL